MAKKKKKIKQEPYDKWFRDWLQHEGYTVAEETTPGAILAEDLIEDFVEDFGDDEMDLVMVRKYAKQLGYVTDYIEPSNESYYFDEQIESEDF